MKNKIHNLMRSKRAEAYDYFIDSDKVKVFFCSKDRKIEKELEDFHLEADLVDVLDAFKKQGDEVTVNNGELIEKVVFELEQRNGWDDISFSTEIEWIEIDQDEIFEIVLELNK